MCSLVQNGAIVHSHLRKPPRQASIRVPPCPSRFLWFLGACYLRWVDEAEKLHEALASFPTLPGRVARCAATSVAAEWWRRRSIVPTSAAAVSSCGCSIVPDGSSPTYIQNLILLPCSVLDDGMLGTMATQQWLSSRGPLHIWEAGEKENAAG